MQLAGSSVLQFAIHRIADQTRRNGILHFLSYSSSYQPLTTEIEQRGILLNKLGFKRLDALHLATAEALKVDVLLPMTNFSAVRISIPRKSPCPSSILSNFPQPEIP